MAKVQWSSGIDFVSGALSKPGKNSQHTHEKMLLATHRTAATTNPNCNRIYLREKTVRTTPVSADEQAVRNRFKAVASAVAQRKKDLSHVATDLAAFNAQKETGYKTLRAYLWSVCGAIYDQQNP
jgi:hypothetical protein